MTYILYSVVYGGNTHFFSAWLGNGRLFYLPNGKDRHGSDNKSRMLDKKCNQVSVHTNSSSNELPKVFGPNLRSFKAYKWRDCLNYEAAFCYQQFSVSLNLYRQPLGKLQRGYTMKSKYWPLKVVSKAIRSNL